MRTKTFVVPKNMIALFFDHVDDGALETTLSEITEEEELLVDVHYEEGERDEVMNLIELLDDDSELPDEEEEEYEKEEEEPEVKPKRKPRKKPARR